MRLLIFVLLCLQYCFYQVDANEEHYLAYSLQYINPAWIPNSFSFEEFPGTRLLFQLLVGPLLLFLPFELVAFLGRAVVYALMCFPLAAIFKAFGISNFSVFVFFTVFFRRLQTFFGGEWMFRAFETKSLSYVFVAFALLAFVQGRYKRVMVLAALATYFHVLVGAWFALAFGFYVLLSRMTWHQTLTLAVIYGVLVLPIVGYLFSGGVIGGPSVIQGVDLNWVYSYFRVPHHTVVFHHGTRFFLKFRLEGILWVSFFTGVAIYVLRRRQVETLPRRTLLFALATYLIILVNVVAAYFDRSGVYLKFYPFRIGTVSYFLTYVLLLAWAQHWRLWRSSWAVLLGCLLFFYAGFQLYERMELNWRKSTERDEAYERVLAQIAGHITPGQSTMVLNFPDHGALDFSRKTRSDSYVVHKFLPAGGLKVYHWYRRWLVKKQLDTDISLLPQVRQEHDFDYIFSRIPLSGLDSALVFRQGDYCFYDLQ
ncbi:MAG: hypothetical protein HC842_02950 [Cytophagales bacterium]|nr:hypothetical protein [Cytophagales bacterium]